MCDSPRRYSGDTIDRGGGACIFYGLMEGYTTFWRHWTLRLVAPSLPVDCLHVFFEFFSVAVGGVVCQVFVSWILVPREPCGSRLLVESVVFTTDTPPGVQGGSAISVTGCGSMQNRDFQALRMPRSFREIGL